MYPTVMQQMFRMRFQKIIKFLIRFLKEFLHDEHPEIIVTISEKEFIDHVSGCQALADRDLLFGVERYNKEEEGCISERTTIAKHEFQIKPMVCIDGEYFHGNDSLLRYSGRLTHAYPQDPLAALHVDQFVELHRTFKTPFDILNIKCPLQDYALTVDAHKKWLKDVHIPNYLSFLNNHLEEFQWIGNMTEKSIADYCWYSEFDHLIQQNWIESYEAYDYIRLYIHMFTEEKCER